MNSHNQKRWWKYTTIVAIVRIAGYCVIFYDPVLGVLLSMFLDIIDGLFFGFGGFSLEEYHKMDKNVDYLQYLFMIPIAYGTPIYITYMFLLVYRTAGMVIYSTLIHQKKRWLFVIFPNLAEYYFLAYFLNLKLEFVNFDNQWLSVLLIVMLIKFIHEYYLHVMKSNENLVTFRLMYQLRLKMGLPKVEGCRLIN